MQEIVKSSLFWGVLVSLGFYEFGVFLKKKFHSGLLNPLLIAIVLTVAFVLVFHVEYSDYYESSKYLSYLLTPATVALAIPLYQQFETLKKNWKAILLGILSGVITSMIVVLIFSLMMHFNHAQYVTLLPKSITTAIGMGVSEELGGTVSITVAAIILSGIIGNVIADFVLKLFHIIEPVAKGIGLGSSSHAIGTTKAIELGEVEGAMSGLSIVVAGLITVVLAPLFAGII